MLRGGVTLSFRWLGPAHCNRWKNWVLGFTDLLTTVDVFVLGSITACQSHPPSGSNVAEPVANEPVRWLPDARMFRWLFRRVRIEKACVP